MHVRNLLAACLLGLASANAVAQLNRADMPQMSSAELIRAGGEPTGDMNMKAMPWPIDELLTRDRAEVAQLAWNCLTSPPAAPYSHAFCVNLATALDPPELDTRLPALYAQLDELGRYEVLLHALESGDNAYVRLFADIFDALAASRTVDRRALLAFVYALHVYEPALGEAVAALDIASLRLETLPGTVLDGFPYSDVVRRVVADPAALLYDAQGFNADYAAMLARPMTADETALLQTLRERIGAVQSLPFEVQPGGLAPVLARLSATYAWLNFGEISRSVRFSDVQTTLPEAPRAFTEVMAELCNRENLNFYSDGLVPFSWSVSRDESPFPFTMSPRCVARGGYLFTLHPFLAPRNGETVLQLGVLAAGPVGWLNPIGDVLFRFDSIEAAGGALPVRLAPTLPNISAAFLNLGTGTPDQLGALTIRGTARLRVPTALRVVEADVVGKAMLDMAEGPLRLHYETVSGQALYEWGLAPAACCSDPRIARRLPLSPGTVQLFDTSGVLQQEIALAGGDASMRKLGFSFLDLGNTHTFQPGKLVWTYAPAVEEIEIPVVLEDVRFVPK